MNNKKHKHTPSLSQAQRLRKFSKDGNFFVDTVFAVINEEKPNQKEQVRFMEEDIRKYFPKSYTKSDMQSLKRLYPNLQILSVVTTVYSFILSPKIKVQNL